MHLLNCVSRALSFFSIFLTYFRSRSPYFSCCKSLFLKSSISAWVFVSYSWARPSFSKEILSESQRYSTFILSWQQTSPSSGDGAFDRWGSSSYDEEFLASSLWALILSCGSTIFWPWLLTEELPWEDFACKLIISNCEAFFLTYLFLFALYLNSCESLSQSFLVIKGCFHHIQYNTLIN